LTLLDNDTVVCITLNQVKSLNLLQNDYERLLEVEEVYRKALDSCISIKTILTNKTLVLDTLVIEFEDYKELQKEEHKKKDKEIQRLKNRNTRNFIIFGGAIITLLGTLLVIVAK
jgi:hypothetical protein